MVKDTFYLDGMSAEKVGIRLQNEIDFSAPIPNIQKEAVLGRNGDVLFESGTYANRTATAECFCLQKNVSKALNAVNTFLFKHNGYRRLEIESDPEHFWLARINNGAAILQRMNIIAPFTIQFDCKPQKFLKSGENPVTITDSTVIVNETWNTAKPLIAVHGYGEGFFQIGEIPVKVLNNEGVIWLDCENQNAYNDYGNQNNNVYAPEFPVLKGGENHIYIEGGISKIDIYPRWWDL
jgi:phage-related protein